MYRWIFNVELYWNSGLWLNLQKTCRMWNQFKLTLQFEVFTTTEALEPQELLLNFLHEVGNTFDVFVIKVCGKEKKEIMDHLPMEISRVTKFLLDRRANVTAKLTSTNYSRFGARWSRDPLYHNVFDGCHRC